MAQFFILLHDNRERWCNVSPQEMQAAILKYRAWRERIQARGALISGHKLTDDGGRVVRAAAGKMKVSDGPYSETKEAIGGFFLVEAADYDGAVELTRDSPHLEFGGTIEIRELDFASGAAAKAS
jgi:hypothetical protein